MKLLLLLVCLMPVLCQRGNPSSAALPARQPKFYDFEKAVVDFSLELQRSILRSKGKFDNVVLSPLSIVSVLNMIMAGASGQTYDELRRVLQYPVQLEDERINNKYRSMIRILLTPNRGVDVTLATRMFLQRDYFPSANFTAISNGYYYTGLENVDFTKAIGVRRRINNWVKEETRGLIPSLLTQPLSPQTKMVIVNAVYFKGDWQIPFNPSDTLPADFHVSERETVPVKMMLGVMDVPYVQMNKLGINCKMIGLAYNTTNFGLFLILPDEEGIDGLERLEANLNADRLLEMILLMQPKSVTINLPRMKESEHVSLVPSLRRMGLSALFDPERVDLSRVPREKMDSSLTFNDCIHQAEIEVNEKGTQAAAATALTLNRGGTSRFIANRPFLYFIRDNITGAILFWGRQVRPSPIEL